MKKIVPLKSMSFADLKNIVIPDTYGIWHVNENGDMESNELIIPAEHLEQKNIIVDMYNKGYEMDSFIRAFFYACKKAKVKTTIMTFEKDRAKREVFGYWTVNRLGDMFHCRKKGLPYCYNIWEYDLAWDEAILHMKGKNWVNFNTFIPAYIRACKNKKISEVELITYYHKF